MKPLNLVLTGLLVLTAALAKAEILPFDDDNWVFVAGTQIGEQGDQQTLRLGVPAEGAPFGFGLAIAKTAPFTNAIVEYDIKLTKGRTFGGLRFRVQGEGDFEDFYLRGHQSGNPDANQYMPQYNGVASWELYYGPQYSSPSIYNEGWNRVRMAISGDLMDVFINDMEKPALTIVLKREEQTGGLALWGLTLGGEVWYANVDVQPMETVEIIGTPVPEAAAQAGTVMNWEVSEAFDGTTASGDAQGLSFSSIVTETTGMLNLGRVQGLAKGKDTAYARLIINADSNQTKAFAFGFSDRATVYLNSEPIFSGNDAAFSRDYRFLGTVGFWDTVYLNLKAGENELLIAVSESVQNPTGWAVQGRFADMEGIDLK